MPKFDVKKYAHLARIKVTPKEAKELGKDLEKVLDHFKELEELDTKKVEPMTGGTLLKNVFREDKKRSSLDGKKSKEQFPGEKDGYLKGPKIMDR